MAHGIHGKTLGMRLCKALGLDPSMVLSVSIHAATDDCATITVRSLVAGGEAGVELVETFKDYELVEKPDAAPRED